MIFAMQNGFSQLVMRATRPASNNILDLILSDQPDLIYDVSVQDSPIRSDHLAITFSLALVSQRPASQRRYAYRQADFDAMSVNLSLVDWDMFSTPYCDSEGMYSAFNDYMLFLIDIFTPLSQGMTVRSPLHAFVARLESVRIRSDLSPSLARQLARASTRLRRLTEERLDIRDAKSFFRYANRRLRAQNGPPPLRVNGATFSNDDDKARIFREYFQSVYCPPMPTASPVTGPPMTGLDLISFDDEVVFRKLAATKAKLSRTPDGKTPLGVQRAGRLSRSSPLAHLHKVLRNIFLASRAQALNLYACLQKGRPACCR